MDFTPNPKCNYKYNYVRIFEDIAAGRLPKIPTYRQLILNDLFFNVYFVWMQGASQDFLDNIVNTPFVVDACREVEEGPRSKTLDLWAREHFKSTIITQAETVQRILRNPEERIAIFSYVRPAAKAFLRKIMTKLEESDLLKACFPDILYMNPRKEARKWSEDEGIIVKRNGVYVEATVEAWGLIEGMPTGRHFTHRVYDDIVTEDMVDSPNPEDIFKKVLRKFDSSQNLGTFTGTYRIIGTHYHHLDPLMELRGRTDSDGKPLYHLRIKPATHDGTASGDPVLLPRERLEELRAGDPYIFACQQLLDPTPQADRKLNSDFVIHVKKEQVPKHIFKFLLIDQAGDNPKKDLTKDSWAILLVGVDPNLDDYGASDVYILDAVIEPMGETEAIDNVVKMYMRGGLVHCVGVEKVNVSTTHAHIKKALAAHGRYLDETKGSLFLLRPSGRNKKKRILSALSWPLDNGKIHMVDTVPEPYCDRILKEMDKFPFWHDDALDALSYLYDILADERFSFFANLDTFTSPPIKTYQGIV